MEFINMTPHVVSIRNEAGEEVLALAPSGQIARVAEQREALGTLAGIEISRASYGAVEGLPCPQPGKAYIVSALVLAACQDRPDVFAPGPAVRDTEGRVVGARGLSASAAYVAPTPEPTPETTPTPEPTDKAADTAASTQSVKSYEGAALRVFTVARGNVYEGAAVQEVSLSSGAKISAVVVGEEGRGRKRGLLPVEWRGVEPGKFPGMFAPVGESGPRVCVAVIGKSRAGKPKLLAADAPTTSEYALVVLRTPMGYRGGNGHFGAQDDVPFPGHIIAEGVIAQGAAGMMGSGEQLVAVLPRGVVFRTDYYGRLYGWPAAHYYVFDGEKIVVATREEIDAGDDPIWDAARDKIS